MNGLFRCLLAAAALVAGASHAAQWRVDPARSHLAFVAAYEETGFETRFERFSADIRFDPADPASGHFDVRIDVTSVNSDSVDRDEGMLGQEWFDSARYPQARFVASEFRAAADGWEAVGDLTIKGVSRRIVLPFAWQPSAEGARLRAQTTVSRTDFGIGTGEWERDATIGFEVRIVADLHLLR